ncbi:rhodanese-like domain-containing protein [Nocardioides bruguierae]|uniref:Rhodanese-like domain-containing protein n=1 Tax=Nocardioides bruguierae TaxID=2945102 RepID=A0A9X2IFS6_9ACTN|nr:rhodanese-like domain-containing protein [Nocardioides bruguierae]MCM0622146.1 rhodanese-like domain-containing protein [Nocardioides bruguierae]
MTSIPVPTVDVHEALRLHGEGALLLDVREPDEWAEVHVDGATHLPLGHLDPADVPSDRLVVACAARATAPARPRPSSPGPATTSSTWAAA